MGDPAPGKIESDKAGWFVRDYFPDGVCPVSTILLDAAGSGVGIDFGASAFTDGILIDGICGDAIHISGANTVSAVHISGDQATAILVDVDASVATGLSFAVDTGKTMTTGIDMTCTGTGAVTTAISLTGAMTTGIRMAGGESYNPIHIGTKGNTAGSGLDMSGADSYDDHNGVMVFCDDGGSLAATYTTSAIWTRYLISQSQSSNTATGAYLQMKSLAATFTACDYSATKAYLELSGATTLASGGLAVINAGLELGGAFTDTANMLSGIDVNLNDGTNALSTAKNSAGVRIRKTSGSTAGWPIGVYIEDSGATTGIEIGNCTNGIVVSGVCSGSAIDVTGTNTGRALRIGTKVSEATSLKISSGETVDAEPANNYLLGLFTKVDATEATSTDELRSAWIRTRVNADMHVGETANWGYGVCGAEVQLKFYGGSGGTDTHAWQNSALWAQLETAGATTNFKSGSVSSCVLANVGLTATTVIDSGAVVAGVSINSNTAGSNVTATGGFYGMYIYQDNSGCLDFKTAIKLDDNVATTGIDLGICTTGMLISGATTEAIDITGNATRAINIDTGAFTSGLTMSAAFSGNAISVTNSALTAGDSYSGVRVAVTAPAATNAYGMAGYFDTTITGTTAGHCYGLGSWINTSTTPVLSASHIIVPLECGVYTGEAQASARIVLGQFQAVLNGAPASLHVFRINTTQTTTAVFAAANDGSLAFTASGTTGSNKNGDIPIADIAGRGVVYVRTYDAAG